MPIGTSDGQYYETAEDQAVEKHSPLQITVYKNPPLDPVIPGETYDDGPTTGQWGRTMSNIENPSAADLQRRQQEMEDSQQDYDTWYNEDAAQQPEAQRINDVFQRHSILTIVPRGTPGQPMQFGDHTRFGGASIAGRRVHRKISYGYSGR